MSISAEFSFEKALSKASSNTSYTAVCQSLLTSLGDVSNTDEKIRKVVLQIFQGVLSLVAKEEKDLWEAECIALKWLNQPIDLMTEKGEQLLRSQMCDQLINLYFKENNFDAAEKLMKGLPAWQKDQTIAKFALQQLEGPDRNVDRCIEMYNQIYLHKKADKRKIFNEIHEKLVLGGDCEAAFNFLQENMGLFSSSRVTVEIGFYSGDYRSERVYDGRWLFKVYTLYRDNGFEEKAESLRIQFSKLTDELKKSLDEEMRDITVAKYQKCIRLNDLDGAEKLIEEHRESGYISQTIISELIPAHIKNGNLERAEKLYNGLSYIVRINIFADVHDALFVADRKQEALNLILCDCFSGQDPSVRLTSRSLSVVSKNRILKPYLVNHLFELLVGIEGYIAKNSYEDYEKFEPALFSENQHIRLLDLKFESYMRSDLNLAERILEESTVISIHKGGHYKRLINTLISKNEISASCNLLKFVSDKHIQASLYKNLVAKAIENPESSHGGLFELIKNTFEKSFVLENIPGFHTLDKNLRRNVLESVNLRDIGRCLEAY